MCQTKPHSHWYPISDSLILFICTLFSYFRRGNTGSQLLQLDWITGIENFCAALLWIFFRNFSNVYSQNAWIMWPIHFNPRMKRLMINSIEIPWAEKHSRTISAVASHILMFAYIVSCTTWTPFNIRMVSTSETATKGRKKLKRETNLVELRIQ